MSRTRVIREQIYKLRLLSVCVRVRDSEMQRGRRARYGIPERSRRGSGTKPRNMGMRGGLILSGENKYPSLCAPARPQLSWNPD